ncbi:spore coat protein CotJB [Roseburia hominis]
MNQEHLAIASVPIQRWSSVLTAEEALKTGTIFQELNKPFFVTEESSKQKIGADISAHETQSSVLAKVSHSETLNEREQLMMQIQEVSFVLDDIRLYMDTHPSDKEGLDLLKKTVKRRKELLMEFAHKFYPLTVDCMADIYEASPDSLCYSWQEGPMPWEGACV